MGVNNKNKIILIKQDIYDFLDNRLKVAGNLLKNEQSLEEYNLEKRWEEKIELAKHSNYIQSELKKIEAYILSWENEFNDSFKFERGYSSFYKHIAKFNNAENNVHNELKDGGIIMNGEFSDALKEIRNRYHNKFKELRENYNNLINNLKSIKGMKNCINYLNTVNITEEDIANFCINNKNIRGFIKFKNIDTDSLMLNASDNSDVFERIKLVKSLGSFFDRFKRNNKFVYVFDENNEIAYIYHYCSETRESENLHKDAKFCKYCGYAVFTKDHLDYISDDEIKILKMYIMTKDENKKPILTEDLKNRITYIMDSNSNFENKCNHTNSNEYCEECGNKLYQEDDSFKEILSLGYKYLNF